MDILTEESTILTEDILCIGYLKKPMRLSGAIKVKSHGELLRCYSKGEQISSYLSLGVINGLLNQPKFKQHILIEDVTLHKDGYLLKPKGVNTREEASIYCGYFLGISVQEAKKKYGGSSQPYLFEYLGMKVVDYSDKKLIGSVIRIEEIQERVIFIVKFSDKNNEIMLPFLSDYFVKIDIQQNILYTKKLHELV